MGCKKDNQVQGWCPLPLVSVSCETFYPVVSWSFSLCLFVPVIGCFMQLTHVY